MPEVRRSFSQQSEIETITAEMAVSGYRLKEVQQYKDGWWLIFTGDPVTMTLAEQVADHEKRIKILEEKVKV